MPSQNTIMSVSRRDTLSHAHSYTLSQSNSDFIMSQLDSLLIEDTSDVIRDSHGKPRLSRDSVARSNLKFETLSESNDLFIMDPYSGWLSLNHSLDAEKHPTITLKVNVLQILINYML